MAEEFLVAKGYTLMHRNWRAGHKEIDLVALDGDELVFIEIKTRGGVRFGYPEEAVSAAKQNHLRAAAERFLELHPAYTTARFDVVSILLRNGAIVEMRHYIDAF